MSQFLSATPSFGEFNTYNLINMFKILLFFSLATFIAQVGNGAPVEPDDRDQSFVINSKETDTAMANDLIVFADPRNEAIAVEYFSEDLIQLLDELLDDNYGDRNKRSKTIKKVKVIFKIDVFGVEIALNITYEKTIECPSGSGDGEERTKRSKNLLNEHEITFRNPLNGKSFQYYSNELFFTLIDLEYRITNANNTVTE